MVLHKCEFCVYTTKRKDHLTRHNNYKHYKDEDIVWFYCDEEKCNFKCKEKSDIKPHKVNVNWVYCDFKDCDFKCKANNLLKQHKNIHSKEKPFKCDQEGCYFECKANSYLKRHKRNKHDIEAMIYECDQENCYYSTKDTQNLKSHKSNIHNIGVKWYCCDQDSCIFKCKSGGGLKVHKMYIHNIGVNWVYCEFPECTFKSKRKGDLKSHFKSLHTKEGAARQKKEENKIKLLLEKNDITFERETRIDFSCFDSGKHWACIDFVLYRKDYTVLLEVDENQHKYGYTVSCDMKRMNHILTTIRCEGNTLPVLFLRYNPHTFKINYKTQKITQKERQNCLLKFLNNYKPEREGLEIKYFYYDQEETNEKPIVTKTGEYKEMCDCVI